MQRQSYEFTSLDEMFPASDNFRVFVDGKELKVVRDDEYDYVNIVTKDIVNVEVIFNGEVESVALRPTRREKKYTVDGKTVRFSMSYGDYYSLEVNGDLDRPLLLFCDEPIPMQKFDGMNLLYFKPGSYTKVDILSLESNTVVFIDEGAVMDGRIDARGVSGLRILGNGIMFAKNRLSGGGAQPINLENCTDVEINGVTIIGYHTWNIRMWKCRNVTVENVKIMSYNEWSDGIDVMCSENIVIRHVFVKNEDDCISIKASKHRPYNFEGGDVKNILVENCVFWSGPRGNSMEIGYELNNGTIEDITFRNIDVIHRQTRETKFNRTVISIHNAGNTTVRNVTYENIYAEETEENFIMIAHMHVPVWGLGGGKIENVRLSNVNLSGGELRPSLLSQRPVGLPADKEHSCSVKDITFENLTIHGEYIDSTEKAKKFGFVIDEDIHGLKFI